MDGHTAVGDRLSVDPCMVFKGKGGLQSGIMAGNPAGRCFGLPYVVGPRSGAGQGLSLIHIWYRMVIPSIRFGSKMPGLWKLR